MESNLSLPEISREDTRSPTPLLDDGRKRERFERGRPQEETGDTVPRTSERLLVKKTQSSLAEPIASMHESPQISKSQTLSDKITDLKRNCHDPNAIIIKDIGSGINWNRPGFKRLLELVDKRKVATLTIAHRDRLCRFAYELVERIFEKAGVKIMVLSQGENHNPDPQKELSEDLLAITNHFVAQNNGLRFARNRRQRKENGTGANDTAQQPSENEENGSSSK